MTSSALVPSYQSALINSEPDVLAQLLAGKRSRNTQNAYAKDLRDFFYYVAGVEEPTAEIVKEFLELDQFAALSLVLKYKAHLSNERKLKEATVNRRLAAIKSLVRLGNQLGQCRFTLAEVKGDKIVRYRDTTGISKEAYRKMLAIPALDTLKGKRDYAILRLLWDNALRRGEIEQADIKDLDLDGRSLLILGKGKGQQKQSITLSRPTVEAITQWLHARRELDINQPLFIALDRSSYGHRLTGTAIYKIVESIATGAGITKKLSPHRIRHSSVTAALDATGGDVRKVQKLSRHADLNTLMIYDDNRLDVQGEISDLLSGLV
ncbi:tyrosine-type recombinase/integrase [Gloeothece verrucosa]|uniref:Integrase family protein n=1 Tax=Gloeothece verrucosa (strain PCC 7822) TaxID=497965 RepID=E0UNU2_GLOV7|nr:tyrosine-type recombinase/integrase [Gloeothece verrucosa]ADN18622.1 integrase family protein [Gloeothece verrucosa PCC 7822]